MRAVRVEAEGLTTSFRYPHFLVGRQPSFRMPPPATIYGHVCSAVGEFLDPAALRFAYMFQYAGSGDDVELLHIAELGTGRLQNDPAYPRNLNVTTNPTRREVLLHPRLTLYLSAEDTLLDRLSRALSEPRYVVALGRSQDLFAYRSVQDVEMEREPNAYLEATLLPWTFRLRTRNGTTATMPRFIDPSDRRNVTWSPYLLLEDRVFTTSTPGSDPRPGMLVASAGETWWIDPLAPPRRDRGQAVVWHSFVDTPTNDASPEVPAPPSLG